MPDLTQAFNWAVLTCNAPNIGYSQTYRRGQTVGGVTYYDCSSFVSAALFAGGFFNSNPWFTTYNEVAILEGLGFERFNPLSTPWQRGDIMWKSTHTEIVYDPDKFLCMGAHTNTVPLADQVSISKANSRNYWTYGFRYTGGVIHNYEWHAKTAGAYSRDSVEAFENAMQIYSELFMRGWSLSAVSGLLGNFEIESGYNPWRWEGDIVGTPSSQSGYGLAQFTPAGKYINSPLAQAYEGYSPYYNGATEASPNDGKAQIVFIDENADYYPTAQYPLSYQQFKENTQSPEYSAKAWLFNYERPLDPSATISQRIEAAKYWFDVLGGTEPIPPYPPIYKKRRYKFYLYG